MGGPTCGRCGAFTQSRFMLDSKILCEPCYERLSHVSSRARTAQIFAILAAAIACLPLAIPAIVLGKRELNAIERGEAPPGGRDAARNGYVVGIFALVWPLVVLSVALLFAVADS